MAFRILGCFFALSLTVVPGTAGSCNAQGQDPPAEAKSPANPTDKELWYGVLDAEVRKFRFAVEIDTRADPLTAVLRSLDEGNRIFPLSEIVKNDRRLSFTLPLTKAQYEGEVDDTGSGVRGKWKQNGVDLPLEFNRVAVVPAQSVKHAWKGTINAVIQKIEVAFTVLDSGEVFFASVTQKAGGFTATREEKDNGEVIFRVPGVGGVFTGEYSNAKKTTLVGRWRQGLGNFELTLQRVKEVASPVDPSKTNRPQTPKAPFSYRQQKVQFQGPNDEVMLAGTLTIPAKGAKAAVVLVSGSGPQDRDETILGHKPFWVIADHFAKHGIATLRYDDRGVALSTGKFSTGTSLDFADDAEAALEFLATHPDLSKVPLGLCGHSEGGLLAPIIAARNEAVTFIVLLAAPGVNGEKIIMSQTPLLMRAQGVDETLIDQQSQIQGIVLEMLRETGQVDAELLIPRVRAILGDSVSDDEIDGLVKMITSSLAKSPTIWLRTFLTLDPATALRKVDCAVLALNGSKDLQVDPSLNLPKIEAALESGGNDLVEAIVYNDLNHLFQKCKTGSPLEYAEIEETFNQAPLQKMTDWILKQAD